ncbi:MAG: PH domain-containing protein [Capnocytophaga felis]|nr:PH domain-containing protein [Capnocytophaga felis]
MERKFLPKFDLISTIVTIVLSLVIIVSASILFQNMDFGRAVVVGILLVVTIVVVGCFPVFYVVTEQEIVIKRLFSKKIIKISNIKNLYKIKNMVSYTFSTKGFFGYLGKTMDGATSYSTSLKHNLLIETTDNEKIIVSPSNIELFENEVKKNQR